MLKYLHHHQLIPTLQCWISKYFLLLTSPISHISYSYKRNQWLNVLYIFEFHKIRKAKRISLLQDSLWLKLRLISMLFRLCIEFGQMVWVEPIYRYYWLWLLPWLLFWISRKSWTCKPYHSTYCSPKCSFFNIGDKYYQTGIIGIPVCPHNRSLKTNDS